MANNSQGSGRRFGPKLLRKSMRGNWPVSLPGSHTALCRRPFSLLRPRTPSWQGSSKPGSARMQMAAILGIQLVSWRVGSFRNATVGKAWVHSSSSPLRIGRAATAASRWRLILGLTIHCHSASMRHSGSRLLIAVSTIRSRCRNRAAEQTRAIQVSAEGFCGAAISVLPGERFTFSVACSRRLWRIPHAG